MIGVAAIFWLVALLVPVRAQEKIEGEVRIEQEAKLTVPAEKAGEVRRWLEEHFVTDQTAIKKLNQNLKVTMYMEDFVDTYFDTPDLWLSKNNHGVRYRVRENLTNAADPKSGRELVQIKLSGISANNLNRGEYKFKVDHGKQLDTPEGLSPVMRLIDPKERPSFKQQISELKINPFSLKPIVVIYDDRQRIYLELEGKPFTSISLDHVTSNWGWGKVEFWEIEPELNEITYTEAGSEKRVVMEQLNKKIIEEIRLKFPQITQDQTPKYSKVINQLKQRVPFFGAIVWLKANLD